MPHSTRDSELNMDEPHLRTAVDDVDLVQRDDVGHLLSLLQLAFRALHEPCRRPCAAEPTSSSAKY